MAPSLLLVTGACLALDFCRAWVRLRARVAHLALVWVRPSVLHRVSLLIRSSVLDFYRALVRLRARAAGQPPSSALNFYRTLFRLRVRALRRAPVWARTSVLNFYRARIHLGPWALRRAPVWARSSVLDFYRVLMHLPARALRQAPVWAWSSVLDFCKALFCLCMRMPVLRRAAVWARSSVLDFCKALFCLLTRVLRRAAVWARSPLLFFYGAQALVRLRTLQVAACWPGSFSTRNRARESLACGHVHLPASWCSLAPWRGVLPLTLPAVSTPPARSARKFSPRHGVPRLTPPQQNLHPQCGALAKFGIACPVNPGRSTPQAEFIPHSETLSRRFSLDHTKRIGVCWKC